MTNYGVQIAFGVCVRARSLLYLITAWTNGLAAAHEFCTRLAAEATVRRPRPTVQDSAAARLPPALWQLVRNELVLQAVEDVERNLLRQTLCPTCRIYTNGTSEVSSFQDFLACVDCLDWSYETELDVLWARDHYEEESRTLLAKFDLEETALPLISADAEPSLDLDAACAIILSRERDLADGMICANVSGHDVRPDRGQVRRLDSNFSQLPADATARFSKLFRMFPSLRAVKPPTRASAHTSLGGGGRRSPLARPSKADTSGGEGRHAQPYSPDEPRWMLLSGYYT